jgi:Cytochrome oxidase complex assembly protein 1
MRLTSFRLTHGTNSLAAAHAAAELVRKKLEMGRAARLSFARVFRGWMRPPGILICNRHNETIGCLQNRAHPRASEPGCDRSDRLTHFANRNRVGQQQWEWNVGEANPSIPLSGPKGKATLYVEAKKSADTWFFQTMVVKIERNGERIDLNKLLRQ